MQNVDEVVKVTDNSQVVKDFFQKVLAPEEPDTPTSVDETRSLLSQPNEAFNPYRREHALHDLLAYQIRLRNAVIQKRDEQGKGSSDNASVLSSLIKENPQTDQLHIFFEYNENAKGERIVQHFTEERKQEASFEKWAILKTLKMLPEGMDYDEFMEFCLSCPKRTCRTNEEMRQIIQETTVKGEVVGIFPLDKDGKQIGNPRWSGFKNDRLGISATFSNDNFGLNLHFTQRALQKIVDAGPAKPEEIPQPPQEYSLISHLRK